MTLQPQLIAPFETGLVDSVQPWLAPADSFVVLNNFHVHHLYVQKRRGTELYGYMAYTTSNGSNSFFISNITNATIGIVTTTGNHNFQVGQYVSFYKVGGMGKINYERFQIPAAPAITPTTFPIGDTSNLGTYTAGGIVFLSPRNPIMGMTRYLKSDGTYEFLIFDTLRMAKFDPINDYFIPVNYPMVPFNINNDIFTSSDVDYVWSCQWQSPNAALNNIIYFTNGKPRSTGQTTTDQTDGIQFYPDPNGNIGRLLPIVSQGNDNTVLYGCKLIFVLAERLIVMNTYEAISGTISNYPQRARYCQSGNPSNDKWREGPGGGGFIDAPTGDQIISGRSYKDGIVVFMTNSVWVLRYNIGNAQQPYRWYKLNDFRACGGKMASIAYDENIKALGIRGITASDYNETNRIDQNINDFVVNNINTLQFDKVFCERNYAEHKWWTLYPEQTTTDDTQDTGVLVYDDYTQAYSTYSIPLNALGYANLSRDYTFADFTPQNNLDYNWLQVGNATFDSRQWQNYSEALMGGDAIGIIYQLDFSGSDNGSAITSTATSAYWNPFKEEGMECQMSYIDFYLESQYNTTAVIDFFKNDDEDPYSSQTIDMLPNLSYVTTINNITNANPAVVTAITQDLQEGMTVFFYLVPGMDEINDRPLVVSLIDEDHFSVNVDSTAFGAYTPPGGQIYLREFYTTKVWKRAFAGGIGYQHAVRITTTGINADMILHAMKPYFKRRGKRTTN